MGDQALRTIYRRKCTAVQDLRAELFVFVSTEKDNATTLEREELRTGNQSVSLTN